MPSDCRQSGDRRAWTSPRRAAHELRPGTFHDALAALGEALEQIVDRTVPGDAALRILADDRRPRPERIAMEHRVRELHVLDPEIARSRIVGKLEVVDAHEHADRDHAVDEDPSPAALAGEVRIDVQ